MRERGLANGRSVNNARSCKHRPSGGTETATELIYYWRKTEIKCSATACETCMVLAFHRPLLPPPSLPSTFPFDKFPVSVPILLALFFKSIMSFSGGSVVYHRRLRVKFI